MIPSRRPRPVWRKTATKTPDRLREAADLNNALLRRATAAEAALVAHRAAQPARDREITELVTKRLLESAAAAFRTELPKRDQAATDAAVQRLADAGLLRQKPSPARNVRHVIRDAAGQITGIYDTVEQIEPEEPPSVA